MVTNSICMGRIGDCVKLAQLKNTWENKKEALFTKPNDSLISSRNDSFISSFLKQNDELQRSAKIQQIDAKLNAGSKLSGEEFEFLREHAPEMYTKALKIQREREEYRRALENCKTKEEAQQLHLTRVSATMNAIKEASKAPSGDAVPILQMQLMMMINEFGDFVLSVEYAEMPSTFDADEEEDEEGSGKQIEYQSDDGNEVELLFLQAGGSKQGFEHIPMVMGMGTSSEDARPDNPKVDNVGFKKSERTMEPGKELHSKPHNPPKSESIDRAP